MKPFIPFMAFFLSACVTLTRSESVVPRGIGVEESVICVVGALKSQSFIVTSANRISGYIFAEKNNEEVTFSVFRNPRSGLTHIMGITKPRTSLYDEKTERERVLNYITTICGRSYPERM